MRTITLLLIIIGSLVLLWSPTIHAQILSFNTSIKISVVTNGTNVVSYGHMILNILVTPINSSYVNVTVISVDVNGSAVPMDFQIVETYYNATTGSLGKVTGTWINTTTGLSSEVLLWSPEANSITWDAYDPSINAWIPGYNQYVVTPVTMPIITPPQPFIAAAPLFFMALMIGVAGRHRTRDAALGLIAASVFGGWVMSLLGLGLIQISQVTIIAIFIGAAALLVSGRK
ncbi:MAG: hypothetical protein ACP5NY_04120 [Thermocladium sp.]